MGEASPSPDESSSAATALRLLKMMDDHGPKIMVYIIAAQLLGLFTLIQERASGLC
jgi:hypothetical protein